MHTDDARYLQPSNVRPVNPELNCDNFNTPLRKNRMKERKKEKRKKAPPPPPQKKKKKKKKKYKKKKKKKTKKQKLYNTENQLRKQSIVQIRSLSSNADTV